MEPEHSRPGPYRPAAAAETDQVDQTSSDQEAVIWVPIAFSMLRIVGLTPGDSKHIENGSLDKGLLS